MLQHPATWHRHAWMQYALRLGTEPLANAFVLGLYDQVLKVRTASSTHTYGANAVQS